MDDQFNVRLEKLKKLEALGVTAYPYRFDKTHTLKEIISDYRDREASSLEEVKDLFRIAGRVVAIREMGKSVFMHLFDGEEKLQVYIRKERVSEQAFQVVKLLDIGDIVGMEGGIFKTHSGELTILVSQLTFLSKSFRPLPEKWHGLQDKELRFRNRALDLIVNPDARRIFQARAQMIQRIRDFFLCRGYLEVETPMMQPMPGGAAARPFVTHHNALDMDLYLRVAPELYLKRLLVGGMERIFEINRNFRNEGISMMHNPEFTMIEFYELYKDFHDYMRMTEELLQTLASEFLVENTIVWNGKSITMHPPFPRIKYMDLLAEKTGMAASRLLEEDALRDYIQKHFPDEEMPPTFGKKLELLFDRLVEESLVNPTFVTYFPKANSPLSKVSRQGEQETERFELYIAGMEIANGFSELNDPIDQRQRFESQQQDRLKGDDEAHVIDQNFLYALEHGMAPAAGEGIGIDRLVMLFTGASSIKEVILFPLLRQKE